MRYAWLGFHIVMVLLLVMTFAGVFSPPKTGNFAQDNGAYIPSVIGLVVIWIVGTVIFRVIRRFSRQ